MSKEKQMIEVENIYDDAHIAEREKRIKVEKTRLNKLIKDINADRKQTADAIIDNLAFIRIKCEDLRAHMLRHGVVEEYQNGVNQWGKKKSSEFEVYNQLIKNYIPLSKQFMELLPKVVAQEASDGFDEFVGGKPL